MNFYACHLQELKLQYHDSISHQVIMTLSIHKKGADEIPFQN